MARTMRAAVLYGKEDVRVERVNIPAVGAGDLLVRVGAALTCGTDVKVFRRGYHARMIVAPSVFGHEVAGEVVAVGRDVANFCTGDRVVASNSAPCGICFHCTHAQLNLCEHLVFNNGAYAEFLRVPALIVEQNTYHVPESISFADAALMEPLACVVQGLNELGVRSGETVAIIGLGPIGMMFVKLASRRGATVIAIGRRREQIDRAIAMGAVHGVISETSDQTVHEVRAITGRGADIAIEAVGKPELWADAVRMLRRGGRVNFFGGCPSGSEVRLPTELLHYSGLTCLASFHHTPETNREALDVICAGHITARDFVGAEETLTAVPDVLRRLARENASLKTAILP